MGPEGAELPEEGEKHGPCKMGGGFGGRRYSLHGIDIYTRFHWVLFAATMNEAGTLLKKELHEACSKLLGRKEGSFRRCHLTTLWSSSGPQSYIHTSYMRSIIYSYWP